MNKNMLKIGGIVAIVLGAGALFISGTSENIVIELVAGVFVVAGVIATLIKDKVS